MATEYAWHCNERYYIDCVQEVLKVVKDVSLKEALQALTIYRDESLKIFSQTNINLKDTIYDFVIFCFKIVIFLTLFFKIL